MMGGDDDRRRRLGYLTCMHGGSYAEFMQLPRTYFSIFLPILLAENQAKCPKHTFQVLGSNLKHFRKSNKFLKFLRLFVSIPWHVAILVEFWFE
jgi:hypothetical protein